MPTGAASWQGWCLGRRVDRGPRTRPWRERAEATAHAHEAGGHACEQTNGEKHQQSQGIKGHDGEIQKSKFKDKVKRRGKVMPSSTP